MTNPYLAFEREQHNDLRFSGNTPFQLDMQDYRALSFNDGPTMSPISADGQFMTFPPLFEGGGGGGGSTPLSFEQIGPGQQFALPTGETNFSSPTGSTFPVSSESAFSQPGTVTGSPTATGSAEVTTPGTPAATASPEAATAAPTATTPGATAAPPRRAARASASSR